MSITILHECKCKPLVADLLAALKQIATITRPQTCMDGSAVVGSRNATGYDFQLIARAAIARAEGGAK